MQVEFCSFTIFDAGSSFTIFTFPYLDVRVLGKPVQGGAFQEKGGITSVNAKEASLADIVREVRDDCLLKIG